MFGNPETTPGGRALKFYASLRLDIRRIGVLKDGETVVGSRVRVKAVKNKVAPPFREAEFDILFDRGIRYAGDVLDLGAKFEIVGRSGSWFALGETRLGQGRDKACDFLEAHPEILREIEGKIREKSAAAG
jgi:recombination protein RecA